jgi:hypothetical protein
VKILALDLGTKTGWALRIGKDIISGEQEFKPVRFEGGGMRYLKFTRWLNDLIPIEVTNDLMLVFEEVRNHGKAGVDAAHAYGGFMATLTQWCEVRNIPYMGVPVGTIKISATGKGNSSKPEMIRAMKAKGHKHLTEKLDNEADALALLYWADVQGYEHIISITAAQTKELNETPSVAVQRSAPDRKSKRRVPVQPVPVVRKRVRC